MTEDRDIPKKLSRNSPRAKGMVRLHAHTFAGIPSQHDVPCAKCASQLLLRLAPAAPKCGAKKARDGWA
jgi:hypothetical protein